MKSSNTLLNMLLVIFFVVAFIIISMITAKAQSVNSSSYSTAIGLRGGGTSGLTIKHFTNSNTAIEGILSFWHRSVGVTGLYEKHAGAFSVDGMRWYYGGGAHIYVTGSDGGYYNDHNYRYYRYRDGGFGFGVDGIVGLEYKINPIPFAISIDLKPAIDVTSGGNVYFYVDPGLGIKFTF
jgi:ABC-type multidrug transport system permease subunit